MANQYRRLPNLGGTQREVAEVVNNLVEGKINSTGSITLATGGATTTTLTDRRIGPDSVILFMPVSIAAAATNYYPFGLFESDASQTITTANTPQIVTLNDSEYTYGTSLSSNQITVDYAGLYNIHVEATFINSDSQIHDAYLWLRVNGVNVDHTTSWFGVSDKQGATNGATRASVSHPIYLSADDYVELVVEADDTDVSLLANAAQTTPHARPSSPSVLVELRMDQPSQTSGTAFEMYVSDRENGQATINHLPNSIADKTFAYVILG